MFGFSSTYSPLFLALIFAIAAAASWLFYRNTQVLKWKKILLICIKTFAIFILLALFIEPVISYITNNNNNLKSIVLIDVSRSSGIENRHDKISNIYNNYLSSKEDIFTFSTNIKQFNHKDSLVFNGAFTNISSAFRNIKENYPDNSYNSITLISDGIFNDGGNPLYEAEKFNVPFVIFPVGDTTEVNDVVIKNVLHNDKAFTGSSVKIRVIINVFKAGDGILQLKLLREGNEISTQQLHYLPSQNTYEAEFTVTENTPAKIHYSISAENIPGELTDKNNNSDFFITYIDNKINILVLSGGPGYDNEFTGSVLKRIGNYNITYKTQKSAGDFYEGPLDTKAFPELSAVFLLNFPVNVTSSPLFSEIANAIKQFKIPVIFFAGKNTDYGKLSSLDDILPFTLNKPNSSENLFKLAPVSGIENGLQNVQGIGSTNDIFRNVSGIMPKPGSVTLATDKASGEPVLLSRITGMSRSAAFLAYGLWKWKLNSGNNSEKTLESLLLELINLTIEKEKRTRFKVYPVRDVFDYTENVKIAAEVYDENYNITRNAKVSGSLFRKDGSKAGELTFIPFENIFYASLENIPAGDYNIVCDAELNGTYLSKATNRVLIDTLNSEYLETRMKLELLKDIADKTGGVILNGDSVSNYPDLLINLKNKHNNVLLNNRYVRFDLWGNKYYLLLAILLFTVEWVLRKRNNIP